MRVAQYFEAGEVRIGLVGEEPVSFLSRHFTLQPGDVILTGTPSGVGAFRNPPVYLRSGDEVSVTIEGIGTLTNRFRTV